MRFNLRKGTFLAEANTGRLSTHFPLPKHDTVPNYLVLQIDTRSKHCLLSKLTISFKTIEEYYTQLSGIVWVMLIWTFVDIVPNTPAPITSSVLFGVP